MSVPANGEPGQPQVDFPECLYEGVGGLALTLAEIRLARDWTAEEQLLAEGIVDRLVDTSSGRDECGLYVGFAGDVVALAMLDPAAAATPLERLAQTVTPAGWLTSDPDGERLVVNDLLGGNAGIVLACLWLGGPLAEELAAAGADALLDVATPTASGLEWTMYGERSPLLPNYSHGTAGIATALAISGHRLARGDLIEAARLGAEHLVAIGDETGEGFRVPHHLPHGERDSEEFSYGWCHGPTGTAQLFGALRTAGVAAVDGRTCTEWLERAARSVRASGLPERLRPGFWDNEGRCCGTAGVLDGVLDRVQTGHEQDLAFADRLAATIVQRATSSPDGRESCCWRFLEHRQDPPELDAGVGWMQGAAGIVAALSRYARIREDVGAARIGLPDNWWMVPDVPAS